MTIKGNILVTGGCGYIGSHTITCLLQDPMYSSCRVVVVDNLSNSSKISLDRVAQILKLSKEEQEEKIKLYCVDLCNLDDLKTVFEENAKFEACIHFAGLKAVGESSKLPVEYYHNNITGTLNLLRLMDEYDCHTIVFSSSATVYGNENPMPLTESSPCNLNNITNPYGKTKFIIEVILRDLYDSKSNSDWNIALLRYFNPIGAHPSGLIGEDPNGIPNNLMPYVAQVAVGRREYLTVFGNDYGTPDGTGVRDYLHVMDLAEGHTSVITYMKGREGGLYTFNLGTGQGYSVLDMVKAMEKACGHTVPYKIGPRRAGDLEFIYADPKLAKSEMKWEAKRNLEDMCCDLWTWQKSNPNGFKEENGHKEY